MRSAHSQREKLSFRWIHTATVAGQEQPRVCRRLEVLEFSQKGVDARKPSYVAFLSIGGCQSTTEYQWKSLKYQWKSIENRWKSIQFSGKSMKIRERWWQATGNRWLSTKSIGNRCKSLKNWWNGAKGCPGRGTVHSNLRATHRDDASYARFLVNNKF